MSVHLPHAEVTWPNARRAQLWRALHSDLVIAQSPVPESLATNVTQQLLRSRWLELAGDSCKVVLHTLHLLHKPESIFVHDSKGIPAHKKVGL